MLGRHGHRDIAIVNCGRVADRRTRTCGALGDVKQKKADGFAGKNRLLSIRDDTIKPYIPRLWANFLDFLALIRDADELGTNPVPSIAQEREAAVVVTAPHSYAIALCVECDGRRNDHVERPRLDENSSDRLQDAERIPLEFRVGPDFAKRHLRRAAQNGNENALVCAPGALDDCTCIHFVLHRKETPDLPACRKLAGFDEARANDA
ncbi:MAG: hypothetical protein MJA32_09090 [Proteobacteria bacterium]|nr:hypothetical protein [Pseudomonadota bacterium]